MIPLAKSIRQSVIPIISPGRSSGADRLQDALASRGSHVVHLTHNDLDAIGADAIHRMAYGEVFTIFCSVGNFRFILEKAASLRGKGDLLSITDLGYQTGMEEKVDQAKQNGWKIEWRDHHRWQKEELDRIGRRIDLLHVDTEVCACGIAARDLRPGDPIAAEVALVVCDYDLWKNKEPRAAVLARVVSREENRDHVRNCLVQGIFSDPFIEEQFRIIQREMEEDIEKSLRRTRIFENRYRIAVAPQYGYPSETAAAIRNSIHSDIEVLVYPSGRFSIRSVPPISHLLAREFRGGGHAHAAGGSFDFSLWDRLAFLLLHSTRQIRKLVASAESI
jgi:oligoribonuclease NrnB/cAMP/cGMP phosphodiesterase (DHH superfamily)